MTPPPTFQMPSMSTHILTSFPPWQKLPMKPEFHSLEPLIQKPALHSLKP